MLFKIQVQQNAQENPPLQRQGPEPTSRFMATDSTDGAPIVSWAWWSVHSRSKVKDFGTDDNRLTVRSGRLVEIMVVGDLSPTVNQDGLFESVFEEMGRMQKSTRCYCLSPQTGWPYIGRVGY